MFIIFLLFQVLFLYPDMTTGLRGEWTGEKIIRPKVVELVSERCRLVHIGCFSYVKIVMLGKPTYIFHRTIEPFGQI